MTSGPVLAVVAALALALVVGAVWSRSGGPGSADFVIRHRPGRGTTVRGRVPLAKVGTIEEFFARDLNPSGPLTVRGSYGTGRALRLTISGPLDAGRRQRVRNFLLDLLG